MIKLLVLGLDGATLEVIRPLCAEGVLPTLGRMIKDGAHGILESTFPPMTAPAWAALATGKNPGKTGVFDAYNRVRKDSREVKLFTSSHVRSAGAYWDYLSRAGLTVAVVNYPFLFPPYEINGVMVSGLGSNPKGPIAYPPAFKEELLTACPRYRIDVPWHQAQYRSNPSLFMEHLSEVLDTNEASLRLLMEKDFDVLTYVISASDFAQHYMWRYVDPSHPYYSEEEACRYGPEFRNIWRRIDRIVAMALEGLPKDAHVLIVSDHGFGCHRGSFYTGSWLKEKGYLHRRGAVRRQIMGFQAKLKRLAQFLAPGIYNSLGHSRVAMKILRLGVQAEVDLRRTLAFSEVNASLVGNICINLQNPSVADGSVDIQGLRSRIVSDLQKTCEELGIKVKVYRPADLYRGPFVELAHDILFEMDEGECMIRFGFGKKFYEKVARDPQQSGIHKMAGVFVAYGPGISREANVENARIYDVAPTILHIMGRPIPDDMDGRVLSEIFAHGSALASRDPAERGASSTKESVRDRVRKLRASGKLP